MQMTDSYAAAVAVTIPILALAAGGEARAIRERVQKPHEEWERQYREYLRQRPLDLDGPVENVIEHLLEVPRLPRLYRVERALALIGAVVWLIVFTLLAIVELLTLQWLADGDPAGHAGLAGLALWSVAVGFAALIVAPMAYLAMPVFLSFDMLPAGLRHNLTGQLAEGRGDVKGLVRQLAGEAGDAFDRVGDRLAGAGAGADPASGEGKRARRSRTNFVSPQAFARMMREELTEKTRQSGSEAPAAAAAPAADLAAADAPEPAADPAAPEPTA
jgi:hypothetical protein